MRREEQQRQHRATGTATEKQGVDLEAAGPHWGLAEFLSGAMVWARECQPHMWMTVKVWRTAPQRRRRAREELAVSCHTGEEEEEEELAWLCRATQSMLRKEHNTKTQTRQHKNQTSQQQ